MVNNVGYLHRSGDGRCRDGEARTAILAWLAQRQIDAVVWTDLASNFAEKKGVPFSVTAALAHLDTLDQATKTKALVYIGAAPPFVQTPLRTALTDVR